MREFLWVQGCVDARGWALGAYRARLGDGAGKGRRPARGAHMLAAVTTLAQWWLLYGKLAMRQA